MDINIYEPMKREKLKKPFIDLHRVLDKRTKSMYCALFFAGFSLIWGECGYPRYSEGRLCFYEMPFHEMLVALIKGEQKND